MFESLSKIQSALKEKSISCCELVEYHLQRAGEHQNINAFLEVYAEEAIASAKRIDKKISKNEVGKLAGLGLGVKDNICYKDHRMQAGSKILDGFISQISATTIARVLEEDAIIIGRQNCDEFAMGSSSENPHFGHVKNFHDLERVAGGSSGGSASAVAADMCLASFGSDTGGSVRQPAAFCGVVGLKPTYSRVSRYGLVAYGSSFDTIGPITKCVEDAALLLEVMAGQDKNDATSSSRSVPSFSKSLNNFNTNWKIGFVSDTLNHSLISPEVKNAVFGVLKWLEGNSFAVSEAFFPLLEYIPPTYYILSAAEASTNLARYDGIRYGLRTENPENLEALYKKTRAEGFGDKVKRRIMLGNFVLSSSYYDTYFTKAQKVRRLIKGETEKLLSQYDFLVLPTTPTTAFKADKFDENNVVEAYLADLFTVQASVSGVPAISIPVGKDSNGLPIGLQIMSKHFEEEKLLSFAYFIEQNFTKKA